MGHIAYIRIIIKNVLSLCRSRNHSGDNKRSRVANHVPGLVAAVPWPGNERRLAEWGRGQTSVQWPWQYAARFIVSRVPASTATALLPGQHAGVQTQVGFLTTYNRPPMDRSGLINCHDDKQKRDTFRSNFALFPPVLPRLLLLDRDRQNAVNRGVAAPSPPPTYRSNSGSLLR